MIRIALLVVMLGVSACGQREQIAEARRSYQGKPDTPAWGTGDRAAWETKIKARQLAQNEYRRIND